MRNNWCILSVVFLVGFACSDAIADNMCKMAILIVYKKKTSQYLLDIFSLLLWQLMMFLQVTLGWILWHIGLVVGNMDRFGGVLVSCACILLISCGHNLALKCLHTRLCNPISGLCLIIAPLSNLLLSYSVT